MTWRDKLELGLKNDAPFRKDNLPESQVRGPKIDAGPGRSRNSGSSLQRFSALSILTGLSEHGSSKED